MADNFKESYLVLQQHAQTLRTQKEPNIDDLLGIVTESIAAYKVCQTRIEAVERALEKAFEEAPDGHATHEQVGPDAVQTSSTQAQHPEQRYAQEITDDDGNGEVDF